MIVLERKVRHFPEVPILQFPLQFLDGCVSPSVFLLKWDIKQTSSILITIRSVTSFTSTP